MKTNTVDERLYSKIFAQWMLRRIPKALQWTVQKSLIGNCFFNKNAIKRG